MRLIYKIFRQDPNTRDGVIVVTSGLGVAVNLLIAAVKIVIGMAASSIAIISEGANNATDAFSSLLTLVGTKVAGKRPNKKHPFGYRRIEYLTGLVVSVLILVTGVEALTSSVKLIFVPEELNVSYLAIAIVAATAFVKFFLGLYTIQMGKKTGSLALEAVGLEGRNDSFVSVVSIASVLIFLIFHVSLDAYAGVFISSLIVKAGFDVLRETISELIGRPGQKELAEKLSQEMRKTDGILGVADIMLHNYGPDSWSGSANIEIDHNQTVGEVYQRVHELQLRIKCEYAVTMVFGVYGVDNDNPEIKAIRKTISSFIRQHEHIKSFHAVYLEPKTQKLYCDFIVDYELSDWDGLKTEFETYMKGLYPQFEIELTVETEYV